MSLWGTNAASSANTPKFVASSLSLGSGKTAEAANNTALYKNVTPNAFIGKLSVGTFGVSGNTMANTNSEGVKIGSPGWVLRKSFQGPVLSLSGVSGNGASFANGETVLLSNGSINATATIVTNASGGIVSANVTSPGLFTNTSIIAFNFTRQKHLSTIGVTGGSGYSNTDYILISNSLVNAVATLTTNTVGGFANAGITVTNVGLFTNTTANTDVTISVKAANGAASNGSGATLTANLTTSTSGSFTVTLGGRAGRVTYETLAETSSLTSANTSLP